MVSIRLSFHRHVWNIWQGTELIPFFSSSTLSFCVLLASVISNEKLAIIIVLLYIMCHFPLAILRLLLYWSLTVFPRSCLRVVFCMSPMVPGISSVCKCMSFSRFWMFGISICSNMCLIRSPLLWDFVLWHTSVLHSFFLPTSVSLYICTTFSLSNHLLMDIMNNAALNIPVQVFVWR